MQSVYSTAPVDGAEKDLVKNYLYWIGLCKKMVNNNQTTNVTNNIYWTLFLNLYGSSRSVMVKAVDCETVLSEFELQSRYYIYFRKNTLGKGMNSQILPAMG